MSTKDIPENHEPGPLLGLGSSDGLGPAPERDLVACLRTRNGRADGFGLGQVCDEAALEIERLRATLVIQKRSYERETEIEVAAERERWTSAVCNALNLYDRLRSQDGIDVLADMVRDDARRA